MMNPIVNMNIVLEKELELEREGLRRTRRWIGDARQVTDARWYRGGESPVPETKHYLGEVNRIAETKPRREARRSILARLLHLPRTRRQPACNEC
jgi:hypothetical protein